MMRASDWRHIKPRQTDKPEPGFYKMRVRKGEPEVGAIIYLPCPVDPYNGYFLDRPRHLCGLIDGRLDVEPERIWLTRSEPVTQAEYEYLIAVREWDRLYGPVHTPPQNEESGAPKRADIRSVSLEALKP